MLVILILIFPEGSGARSRSGAGKRLQFQFIERAPIRLSLSIRLRGRGGRRRGRTFSAAFAIAMRMRGKIEQNILANVRREIDHFRTGQLVVDRKRRHLDVEPKRLEKTDAFQFNRLGQMAGDPERTFGKAEVERVTQRTGAGDTFRFHLRDRTLFLAFEMLTLGLDLAQMNFHIASFARNAFATRAGRKSFTSSPSRAISFTIRELR